MLNFDTSTLGTFLKEKRRDYQPEMISYDYGTVESCADGIVRVAGLGRAEYGELLQFENDVYGIALDLGLNSVGAALLTAWKNAGGEGELKSILEEMKRRGSRYPGGSCGFWGCCGAAVSAGMFFSIITKTTPLSEASWGQGNMLTSLALGEIAKTGGPRCCKRNSFSAVKTAVKFVNETLGVSMKLPDKIVCRFSSNNKECLGSRCPYNKNHTETGI